MLEKPHVWKDHIVCGACIQVLRQPPPVQRPVPAAMPAVSAQGSPASPVVINNIVHNNQVNGHVSPKWSPAVAAILSFFFPGIGQIYKGQVLNGLAWMFLVPLGYFFLIIPGLVLHLCCVLGAAMGDPYRR
jgi:TM2 domain-containing membrane protein YozV